MDFGGAGKAAYRLHKGLQSLGIVSTMLVISKKTNDPSVLVLPSGVPGVPTDRWASLFQHWNAELAAYPHRPQGLEIFTDTACDVRFDMIKEIRDADVINLHWVAGLFDYEHSAQVFKGKKIVWTLHDMNLFTGGCHYVGSCLKYHKKCGSCPQLGSSIGQDLSRSVFEQKAAVYDNLDLTVVTPSRWLGGCSSSSALFGRFRHEVIPYGFPLDTFRPLDRCQIRAGLTIPVDSKLILFGADYVSNERKGFSYLVEALKLLKNSGIQQNLILATFGNIDPAAEISCGFPVLHFGSVGDEEQMALLYNAADVFVLPSLEDNLPNTVVESLACGTPVAAFEVGGVPDMVKHQQNGFLAAVRDADGLAAAIDWCLCQVPEKIRQLCRLTAETNFSLERQARAYQDLYEELSAGHNTVVSYDGMNGGRKLIGTPVPGNNYGMVGINGIRGYLCPGDIRLLYATARNIPKGGLIIEVGSHQGLSSYIMAQALKDSGNHDALIYCVDMWEGGVLDVFMENMKTAGVAHLIQPVKQRSPEAAHRFLDECADLIFIDGDHLYEGCKADLCGWYPKLRPGGKFIGHDYSESTFPGVVKAVNEFVSRHALNPSFVSPHPETAIFEVRKPGITRRYDTEPLADQPRISIITASYNQAQFIEQTIQSVLNQNYANFEHIIIDGDSTDGTLEILKRYPHLKWVSEKDSGQSEAINKGFHLATGDIIAWLNSDDLYLDNAFKTVVQAFHDKSCAKVVMGDVIVFLDGSQETRRESKNRTMGFDDIIRYWWDGMPPQSSVFFRAEVLKKCGLLDEGLHFAMDFDLWLRTARHETFQHIPHALSAYRFHPDSKSGTGDDWSRFYTDWYEVYRRYKHLSRLIPQELLISTVICVEKARGLLARQCAYRAIDYLEGQRVRDMEIIVISDDSDFILPANHEGLPIAIRLHRVQILTAATLAESAIDEVSSYLVHFFPEDILPPHEWYGSHLEHFLNNKDLTSSPDNTLIGTPSHLLLMLHASSQGVKNNSLYRSATLEFAKLAAAVTIFQESALAHRYCIGRGLEIGGSAHNPFKLNTLNVDVSGSMGTYFKDEERANCGSALPVDIEANGDKIPLSEASQDFIVSSNVLEHFPNPIKALLEWDRLLKSGGVIFMIVPHRDRTFEHERERTTLADVVDDFLTDTPSNEHYPSMHYHCWITQDVVAVVEWMQTHLGVQWRVEEVQDVDDKVGNGFTIVIRKLGNRVKEIAETYLHELLPNVSVIVPTFNRSSILIDFLTALEAQTFPHDRFEVIICDDGSKDETATVIKSFRSSFKLLYLYQPNSGPAAARNRTLEKASGTIILIMNDDAIAAPDLILNHVKTHAGLKGQKTAVLGSFPFEDGSLTSPLMYLLQNSDILFQYARMKPMDRHEFGYFWTCNISIERKALIDAGLFDEDFKEAAGEDTELGYRLAQKGYSVLYDPSCRAIHKHSIDFNSFRRRQVSVGRNNILVALKHPEIAQHVTGLTDLEHAERDLIAWYHEHVNVACNAMAFISGVSMLPNAPAAQIQERANQISAPIVLVNQFWLYQGFLEGISRHLFHRKAQNSNMRITFLTPGTTISGGVKIILEYCNRLAERGHIVNLISMIEGYPDWIALHPAINFSVADWRDDKKQILQELPDADVLIATQWYTAYFVAGIPARKGIKFYLVQDYESQTITTPEYADPTYILPLRKIVVSLWLGRLLKERFGQQSEYIRNAIDTTILYPDPAIRPRFCTEQIRIGMLWHTEQRKDSRCGLEAFELVKQRYPAARLILFGTTKPQDIRCDEFRKNIKGSEVREFFSSLDFFVSTSWQEGFGLPGLEAMACGIPLVTTDSGGIADYAVNGDTALVVPPRDPAAIASALILLASNRDLRERLRQTALAKAAEFSWDASVTALEGLLLRATSEVSATAVAPASESKLTLARSSAEKPMKLTVYSLDKKDQACGDYRVQSPLSALQGEVELSWGLEFNEIGYGGKPGVAEASDIIMVQRFFPQPETAGYLGYLCTLDRPIIFEIDDLLTDLPSTNPHNGFGMLCAPHILEFVRKASAVTVSTEELKKHFASYNDTIYVLPNLLNSDLWHKISPPSSGPLVIAYAGTITHSADLAMLEEVLDRIAISYGDRVAFTFMGCATERISNLPGFSYIEFESTFEAYARKLQEIPIDIMLIPLEDNPFNRCKSNIKWLEYSACGYAGIYADLPPYNTSVEHGRTGLLVGDHPQQWYEAISLLIENADLRRSIAASARVEVLGRYSLAANAHKWLDTYRTIIRDHTAAEPANRAKVSMTSSDFLPAPVSIIMPVFNNVEYTRQCLDKLRQNTADEQYELILVDNGSTDETCTLFGSLPATAKVIRNISNLGFAKACNQGSLAASGKYLLFLNNDTEPQPGWLLPLLSTADHDDSIAAVGSKLLFPDGTIQHAGVIIADDRVTPDPLVGKHIYFGFPTNYAAANISKGYQALTAACLLVRRDAFESVQGFDEGYWNGYEDVDLCFKLGQKGWKLIYQPASVVVHHESKSGSERFAKAGQNIRRLHEKWLGTIRPDVIIHPDSREEWREKESPPAAAAKPRVSIIIPAFNQADFTRKCLTALFAVTGEEIEFEAIVVDNASSDWTPEYLKSLESRVRVLTNERNLGFAKACNQGAQAAKGRYLVFLNNDTLPKAGWLAALVRGAESDGADLVGAKLLYPDGTVQHAGLGFADPGNGVHVFKGMPGDHPAVNRKRFMQGVTGACLLLARELFLELGGFDEGFVNGYEDVDLCLRAQGAGKRILYNPESVLVHFEETSSGRKEKDRQNGERFSGRWRGKIRFDDLAIYQAEGLLDPIGEARADRLYTLLGANDNALFIYQNVLARFPEDAGALLNLGRACAVNGRPDDARIFLERLLRLRPGNPAALRELSLATGRSAGRSGAGYAGIPAP
jgi:GT2 family glycosyltransferase/glycosyltransferase involved in cell wall biosynthesis/predicted O-methyltransferase YrrM/SAM-dependent methyltransferase